MPFLPSASCRNLDLPPVNLRFLQSHLTKNAFAIAPTHLCGIALRQRRTIRRRVGRCLFRQPTTSFVRCYLNMRSAKKATRYNSRSQKMIEVFPVRKMSLLSFLLLLLTLPFLVHGSASAQTETLRVMVYDRENMPEEYGSCEDNAWVRYIQSRVLRELDISPRRWKRLTSWPRRKGSSAYEPSCARLRISMRNGIAAWPPISPRAAAAPLKPSVPPIAKALQKRKEIDHGILF